MTIAERATPAPRAGRRHRNLLHQFVTGVAVVTAGPPQTASGVTVSTLSLVSHRPPVVSLALRAGTRSLTAITRHGGFAVSILSADQDWLARRFADPQRPPGMPGLDADCWRPGQQGPLLRDAIGALECRLDRVIPAGDHQLLLGSVQSVRLQPGRPLVNFAGELHVNALTALPVLVRQHTEEQT
jgi:flavin reductase (DIM6/NTAB) family NADH-FMN oxidoreductase RutF